MSPDSSFAPIGVASMKVSSEEEGLMPWMFVTPSHDSRTTMITSQAELLPSAIGSQSASTSAPVLSKITPTMMQSLPSQMQSLVSMGTNFNFRTSASTDSLSANMASFHVIYSSPYPETPDHISQAQQLSSVKIVPTKTLVTMETTSLTPSLLSFNVMPSSESQMVPTLSISPTQTLASMETHSNFYITTSETTTVTIGITDTSAIISDSVRELAESRESAFLSQSLSPSYATPSVSRMEESFQTTSTPTLPQVSMTTNQLPWTPTLSTVTQVASTQASSIQFPVPTTQIEGKLYT